MVLADPLGEVFDPLAYADLGLPAQALAGLGEVADEDGLVAGAPGTGETWCAVRMRQHDADDLVLSAADLVPDPLGMIQGTLAD